MSTNFISSSIPSYQFAMPFEITYKKGDNKYPIGPHTHNGIELYLTLSDLPDVLLNDTVSQIDAGTLIVIPSNCIHQLFQDKHQVYERYIISIDSSWLQTVTLHTDTENPCAFLSINAPLRIRLSKEQLHLLRNDMDQYIASTKQSCFSQLIHFLRILDTFHELIASVRSANVLSFVSVSQKNVNAIISYIQEHITEPITVNDLAKHFFLHPDYISRLFKKHTHTTLNHYINLQKISKARVLLECDMSVSEVQEYLGYSSYSHFFKTFQKYVGISPKQYILLYKKNSHH